MAESCDRKSRTDDEKKTLLELGERLKKARLDKGLSQEDLAHLASFSRSYYTEVETGKRNISTLNLMKLIETLGISPSDFFMEGKSDAV